MYLEDLEKWFGVQRECPGGDGCACREKTLPDWAPDGCPMDAVRGAPFQAVLRAFNAKAVSPLDGWPDGYAAWMVEGLTALEDTIAEKRAKDLEKR